MITAPGKQWLLLCCIVFIHLQLNAQAWTISQCIDTAIQNNLNIRQSFNTIELNRLNVKQSKNNLLPAVNGSLSESLGIGRMVKFTLRTRQAVFIKPAPYGVPERTSDFHKTFLTDFSI